jgi:hypothetical protein
MAAVFMTIVFGMVAFAVDMGRITLARTQLQCAADAAAMAGATALSGGTSTAQSAAQTCGQANNAMGGAVAINPATDIVFGTWSTSSCTFTPISGSGTPNAIQVTCRLSSSSGNALPLLFGGIFSVTRTNVSAQAIAMGGPSTPNCAFIGLSQVQVGGGGYTDSYDSTAGPYNLGTAGNKGSVCSNTQIRMDSGGNIHGDADVPQGGSIENMGTIWGTQNTLTSSLVEPAVNPGNAATVNNNSSIPLTSKGAQPLNCGNLVIPGQDTLTLPVGTYYFASINLNSFSTLQITGQTTIYVAGSVNIAGTIQSSTPATLNLQCMSGQVNFNGGSTSTCVVYAPACQVFVGGGANFFGSIVSDNLQINGGANCHYDTSLGNSGGSSAASLVQ